MTFLIYKKTEIVTLTNITVQLTWTYKVLMQVLYIINI